MFKHLLVPTDGSPLSERAIKSSVQLAKAIGAKVTGFHVIPELRVYAYQPELLGDTRERFAEEAKAQAMRFLTVVEKAASEAGVSGDTAYATSGHPHQAIIEIAREKGCDLIAMASHGRKGVQALLVGSETQKVLAHSLIPVLVFR